MEVPHKGLDPCEVTRGGELVRSIPTSSPKRKPPHHAGYAGKRQVGAPGQEL